MDSTKGKLVSTFLDTLLSVFPLFEMQIIAKENTKELSSVHTYIYIYTCVCMYIYTHTHIYTYITDM